MKKYLLLFFSALYLVVPLVSLGATCSWSSFSKSWLNCVSLTVSNNTSSTIPAGFAIPLTFNNGTIPTAHLQNTAGDIRFVSSTDDTTTYNWYREAYVGNEGTSTIWMNLGGLPLGTTQFSLYYNNSAAVDGSTSSSTFTSSTYALAANLTDTATSSIKDSSANLIVGSSTGQMTPLNATSTQCVLAGCESATSSFINFGRAPSLNTVGNTSSTGNSLGTLSLWVNTKATSTFFGKSDNNNNIGWVLDDNVKTNTAMTVQEVYSATDKNRIINSLPHNQWHQYVVTMDTTSLNTSTVNIYRDGVQASYNSGQQGSGTQGDHSTHDLFLGHTEFIASNKDSSAWFDEFEAIPQYLSSSTILFKYQADTQQIYALGAEQNVPAASVAAKRRRFIIISEL